MEATASNNKEPWWVIALKAAAYVIGLLLAGVGTAHAAAMAGVI